jgi:hypothetical protein
MAFMFYLVLALLVLFLVSLAFLRVNPGQLATTLRYAGPSILAIVGLGLTIAGRAGAGMTLIGLAAALFGRLRQTARVTTSPRRHSHVRSAALEMELDLDTGEMNGLILAGQYEGRELDNLDEPDLKALYVELASDAESLQLMEAYLDRRMAGWRERFDADAGDGLSGAPGSGPMTEQEAYEVLGLGPGASEPEIREAHRRLMKRVHPDAGGSVFLAARINEAKDLLLRRHR